MSDDPTLAAIEQRAQAATAGPWWSAADGRARYGIVAVGEGTDTQPLAVLQAFGKPARKADADFIAHARTDVPYLLDRLRAVTALVDEWIARVGHMRERAERAERQVAAVRALHKRTTYPGITRVECDHDGDEWPCPTIRALDSAQHDPDRTPLGETISGLGTGAEPMSPQDNPDGAQQ